MARNPTFTRGEKERLPTLPIQIPASAEAYPSSSGKQKKESPPFSGGNGIEKYTIEALRNRSDSKNLRTDFFEKTFLGIWLSNNKQPVPYAFRTYDGSARSLDAGCLGFLLHGRKPPELIPECDADGIIVAVSPAPNLIKRYELLGEQRLRERVSPLADPSNIVPALARDVVSEPLGFDPWAPIDDVLRRDTCQAVREGGKAFRNDMLRLWGQRCPLTETEVIEALDAAHIYPYGGKHTNDQRNGILLRADLHRLFDRHLISLMYEEGDLVFQVSHRLEDSIYWQYNGARISRRLLASPAPDPAVVAHHFKCFCEKHGIPPITEGPEA